MKLLPGCNLILLLLTLGCQPKNGEVQTEHIATGEVTKTADSVQNPEKDGTATVHTHSTPKLPLPQPVLQLLEDFYPGWREPVLQEDMMPGKSDIEQGPLIVRADFNGDTLQDLALQLRHGKEVVVVALLQDSTGQWLLHELKREILFNERGTYKSMYYLFLTRAGSRLYDYESGQYHTSTRDGVSVGLDQNATTYLYQDHAFKPFDTPN